MPEKQKVYCGMKQVLPNGYDRFAIPYECLKKGYGACLYANKKGTCGAGRQQQFFNKSLNRLLFVFMIIVVFIVVLFLLDKFFLNR